MSLVEDECRFQDQYTKNLLINGTDNLEQEQLGFDNDVVPECNRHLIKQSEVINDPNSYSLLYGNIIRVTYKESFHLAVIDSVRCDSLSVVVYPEKDLFDIHPSDVSEDGFEIQDLQSIPGPELADVLDLSYKYHKNVRNALRLVGMNPSFDTDDELSESSMDDHLKKRNLSTVLNEYEIEHQKNLNAYASEKDEGEGAIKRRKEDADHLESPQKSENQQNTNGKGEDKNNDDLLFVVDVNPSYPERPETIKETEKIKIYNERENTASSQRMIMNGGFISLSNPFTLFETSPNTASNSHTLANNNNNKSAIGKSHSHHHHHGDGKEFSSPFSFYSHPVPNLNTNINSDMSKPVSGGTVQHFNLSNNLMNLPGEAPHPSSPPFRPPSAFNHYATTTTNNNNNNNNHSNSHNIAANAINNNSQLSATSSSSSSTRKSSTQYHPNFQNAPSTEQAAYSTFVTSSQKSSFPSSFSSQTNTLDTSDGCKVILLQNNPSSFGRGPLPSNNSGRFLSPPEHAQHHNTSNSPISEAPNNNIPSSSAPLALLSPTPDSLLLSPPPLPRNSSALYGLSHYRVLSDDLRRFLTGQGNPQPFPVVASYAQILAAFLFQCNTYGITDNCGSHVFAHVGRLPFLRELLGCITLEPAVDLIENLRARQHIELIPQPLNILPARFAAIKGASVVANSPETFANEAEERFGADPALPVEVSNFFTSRRGLLPPVNAEPQSVLSTLRRRVLGQLSEISEHEVLKTLPNGLKSIFTTLGHYPKVGGWARTQQPSYSYQFQQHQNLPYRRFGVGHVGPHYHQQPYYNGSYNYNQTRRRVDDPELDSTNFISNIPSQNFIAPHNHNMTTNINYNNNFDQFHKRARSPSFSQPPPPPNIFQGSNNRTNNNNGECVPDDSPEDGEVAPTTLIPVPSKVNVDTKINDDQVDQSNNSCNQSVMKQNKSDLHGNLVENTSGITAIDDEKKEGDDKDEDTRFSSTSKHSEHEIESPNKEMTTNTDVKHVALNVNIYSDLD